MTDTKPTPRTDAAQEKYDAIPQQSDGSEAFDLLIDTIGELREVERELAAIKKVDVEQREDKAYLRGLREGHNSGTKQEKAIAQQESYRSSILDCLGEVVRYAESATTAAIKSQPVPVEPECLEKYVRYYAKVSNGGVVQLSSTTILEVLEYIDSLKQQLQVAQQDKERLYMLNVDCEAVIIRQREERKKQEERAEKAEADVASLRLELAQLNGEIPYGN